MKGCTLKKFLVTVGVAAVAVAAIASLGMTSASASTAGVKTITGFQASGISCTSGTCVIVGLSSSLRGKTALVNPATGAVRLGNGTASMNYGIGQSVACLSKTACLAQGFGSRSEAVALVRSATGFQKVTYTYPPQSKDQYNLDNIACPSAAYCWVAGSSAAPGVQLPTWGLLDKFSASGKLLHQTIDKKNYSYGPVDCENKSTCLIAVEPPFSARSKSFEGIRTLVNGKLGKVQHSLAGIFFTQDISCFGTRLCELVGFKSSGANSIPEAVSVNPKTGAVGRPARLPLGDSGPTGIAAQIACYSSIRCVVVGEVTKGSGSNVTTYAAHVVLTRGKVGRAVIDGPAKSAYVSVACASRGRCYAVGQIFVSTLNYQPTIVGKV